MKLFRQIVTLFAVAAFGVMAFAQNPANFGNIANAYAYAFGVNPNVPALRVDLAGGPSSSGAATLTVAFGAVSLQDGTQIIPFATNEPLTVGIGANQETVTPTAVSCSTPQVYQSCSFTATFAHAHGTGDPVTTGTYGFAEAVNKQFSKGGGLVLIGMDFKNAGGTTTTVTSTSGYATVSVIQNIGTVSGSAFSYKSTGTSGLPAAYTVTTVSWY